MAFYAVGIVQRVPVSERKLLQDQSVYRTREIVHTGPHQLFTEAASASSCAMHKTRFMVPASMWAADRKFK